MSAGVDTARTVLKDRQADINKTLADRANEFAGAAALIAMRSKLWAEVEAIEEALEALEEVK